MSAVGELRGRVGHSSRAIRATMDGHKTNYERRAWTTKEDESIAELVRKHGLKKWSVVAADLKERSIGPPRTGKQCRTRYHPSHACTASW